MTDIDLAALTRDATHTIEYHLERPIEARFFTLRSLDVASAARFKDTHRHLRAALQLAHDDCLRRLYRRWVYKIDRRSTKQRERVGAVVRSTVQRTYEKYLRHWQSMAATLYVYRRFVSHKSQPDDERRLQVVPLQRTIEWARILLDEFRSLIESRQLLPDDLLAPLTHGNLQLAGAVYNNVLVHSDSGLKPLCVCLACPDLRSRTFFVEQLYTLSRDMPHQADRRRLTLAQLDSLNKLSLLRMALRHGTPLGNLPPLVRELNRFGEQYAGALALRQSLVRLLAHVGTKLRRWRREGGPLPITQTMHQVLRSRLLMLIEALDCAMLLHRMQRMHLVEDLVSAATRSLAQQKSPLLADNVADRIDDVTDPFGRTKAVKESLRARMRKGAVSDVHVRAEIDKNGVFKFFIEPNLSSTP